MARQYSSCEKGGNKLAAEDEGEGIPSKTYEIRTGFETQAAFRSVEQISLARSTSPVVAVFTTDLE